MTAAAADAHERLRKHFREAANDPPPEPRALARPFTWREPRSIPRREWLYGGHYIRRFLTTTMAPGGLGKSATAIAETLAMASGRPLLGVSVPKRLRVWYWNGEDPLEETERRIAAAAIHYGLTAADLEGWLFIGSGRDGDLILATQTRDETKINEPHVEAVSALLADNRIDLAIIDPFVSSHRVTENDNGAIDLVAKRWAKIADTANAGVELVHHMRKRAAGSGDADLTVEDGRGAVALLAAARSARVLNGMSKPDAEKAGIERRRSYFKVENGKANLAPPPEKADWRRFVSVGLGNGSGVFGADGEDSVGVVVAWEWPEHTKGVRAEDILAVQQVVEAGAYRADAQSPEWVGYAVAKALGLNADKHADKARIKTLLKGWMGGALVVENRKDGKSKERPFVVVGEWVSPTVEVFE